MPDFDLLLAPHGWDGFRDVLSRSLLHISGHPDKFSSLFSWPELNDILSRSGLSYPRLRISQSGQEVPIDAFSQIGLDGIRRLLSAELTSILRQRATLTIQSIEELHEPISMLVRSVEQRLEVPTQANLEACFGDSTLGATRGPNEFDVIVLQLAGDRVWSIFDLLASIRLRDSHDTESIETEKSYSLSPGDVLYLPKGNCYRTVDGADPVLELTMSFRNPTGLDLAARIISNLRANEFMKMDYPRFGPPEAQSSYLTQLRYELTNACNEPGLTLDFVKDIWALAPPPISFGLPFGAMPGNLPHGETLVITPGVRFPRLDALIEDGDFDVIVHGGRPVRLDPCSAAIVECIFRRERMTVSDLLKLLVETASEQEILTRVSGLVKDSLLIVTQP